MMRTLIVPLFNSIDTQPDHRVDWPPHFQEKHTVAESHKPFSVPVIGNWITFNRYFPMQINGFV